MGQPFSVVDVLIPGKAAIDRLPQQAEQPVPSVLPAPTFRESRHARRGQVEGIVQLAIREQTAIRSNPGTVKFELEAAVERDPQRWCLGFTRHIRHDQPIRSLLCL